MLIIKITACISGDQKTTYQVNAQYYLGLYKNPFPRTMHPETSVRKTQDMQSPCVHCSNGGKATSGGILALQRQKYKMISIGPSLPVLLFSTVPDQTEGGSNTPSSFHVLLPLLASTGFMHTGESEQCTQRMQPNRATFLLSMAQPTGWANCSTLHIIGSKNVFICTHCSITQVWMVQK